MTEKWIPICVRAEDYEDVAAWVVEREKSRDDGAVWNDVGNAIAPQKETTDGLQDANKRLQQYPAWSEEALERFANSDYVTTNRWTRALDVCAASDTTWFTTSEIAEQTGMSINEWRDAPRKLTRHLKTHYPNLPQDPVHDGVAWPLLAWTQPGSNEVSWAMPPTTKERWLKVRDMAAK